MFVGAKLFNRDISRWQVSEHTKMSVMFLNAASFNQDYVHGAPRSWSRQEKYSSKCTTSCPLQDDPDWTRPSSGPFCFECPIQTIGGACDEPFSAVIAQAVWFHYHTVTGFASSPPVSAWWYCIDPLDNKLTEFIELLQNMSDEAVWVSGVVLWVYLSSPHDYRRKAAGYRWSVATSSNTTNTPTLWWLWRRLPLYSSLNNGRTNNNCICRCINSLEQI